MLKLVGIFRALRWCSWREAASGIATWRGRWFGYNTVMKSHLVIDLSSLPEDGKQFEGELSAEIFDLPEDDAKAVGPLVYDLFVQRFGSELLLSGNLEAPFEFTCVRSLHPFIQTIRLDPAAISIEILREGEMDVTEALREEVLIQFPHDPRCEDGDEPQECEIDSRYLAVDKSDEPEVETAPRSEANTSWNALDALKDLKDQL